MISKPKPGTLIAIGGASHVVLSTVITRNALANIINHGVVNTVSIGGNKLWSIVLWTIVTGVSWIILGLLWNWAETSSKQPVPARFGWALAALAFTGALIDPVGGFWLWGSAGLYGVWYSRAH